MSKLNSLKKIAFEMYSASDMNDYDSHLTTNQVRDILKHIQKETNYKFNLDDIDGFDGEVIMFLFDVIFRTNDLEQFIYSKNVVNNEINI